MNPTFHRSIAARRVEDLRGLYEDFLEESEDNTVEAFFAYVSEEAEYSKFTLEECQQVKEKRNETSTELH